MTEMLLESRTRRFKNLRCEKTERERVELSNEEPTDAESALVPTFWGDFPDVLVGDDDFLRFPREVLRNLCQISSVAQNLKNVSNLMKYDSSINAENNAKNCELAKKAQKVFLQASIESDSKIWTAKINMNYSISLYTI